MAISSGIYTLAGVVIGGGVTWFAQWRLAARTDRLDNRLARRQIKAELRLKRAFAKGVRKIDPEKNPEKAAEMLTRLVRHPQWDAHANRLARQLREKGWDLISSTYQLLDVLETNPVSSDRDELIELFLDGAQGSILILGSTGNLIHFIRREKRAKPADEELSQGGV